MLMNIPQIEKHISDETKSYLLQAGLYQLIGGAVGAQLIIWLLFTEPPVTSHSITVKLFMLCVYAYSIACGVLCIRSNGMAVYYMRVNQLLQLIGFVGMGYAYKYVAGVYVSIGIDFTSSTKFIFDAGISKFHLYREPERAAFDINLVALLIMYWTLRLQRKIKTEMAGVAKFRST
ncbi:MAG: hypothetical protein JST75_04555 [Bacteroidetes bacterium]|nr:hypothetical protein [Bacteroidota bacterium]